ncbi:MAG: C-GCAxxG-C-C family protein [Dehalococcoidia bacterium]|jgi:C_GCAxxG_C_C family probable redox protein
MSKADSAEAVLTKGFNCSQAVVSTFAEEFGLDRTMAYRVAAAFGGGIGHLGEACGAVTGAVIVIGLKYGMTELDGVQSNKEAYKKVQQLVEQFRSRDGSHLCRELLGFDIDDRQARKEAFKKGIPQKVCTKAVRDAVEIVEDLIK